MWELSYLQILSTVIYYSSSMKPINWVHTNPLAKFQSTTFTSFSFYITAGHTSAEHSATIQGSSFYTFLITFSSCSSEPSWNVPFKSVFLPSFCQRWLCVKTMCVW